MNVDRSKGNSKIVWELRETIIVKFFLNIYHFMNLSFTKESVCISYKNCFPNIWKSYSHNYSLVVTCLQR